MKITVRHELSLGLGAGVPRSVQHLLLTPQSGPTQVVPCSKEPRSVRTTSFTPDSAGHTELERALIKEFRWFSADDLAQWHEPVFPVNILDLLLAEAAQ